jgi:hypothetical protein
MYLKAFLQNITLNEQLIFFNKITNPSLFLVFIFLGFFITIYITSILNLMT